MAEQQLWCSECKKYDTGFVVLPDQDSGICVDEHGQYVDMFSDGSEGVELELWERASQAIKDGKEVFCLECGEKMAWCDYKVFKTKAYVGEIRDYEVEAPDEKESLGTLKTLYNLGALPECDGARIETFDPTEAEEVKND